MTYVAGLGYLHATIDAVGYFVYSDSPSRHDVFKILSPQFWVLLIEYPYLKWKLKNKTPSFICILAFIYSQDNRSMALDVIA